MANNRDVITRFLQGKGLSPVAIAGILGNLQVESSLNPGAYNAGEGAIGIAQWEGGRRTALQNYAARHGGSEHDLNMQLGYLWHELSGSESGALQALRGASSPADAAAIWDAQFERSAGTTRDQRIGYAQQFYSGHGPAGSTSSPSSFSADASAQDAAPTKSDYRNIDSLGKLLDSVPELSKLVDKAMNSDWTLDKFQNAIEDSDWWKHHSDTARSIIIQQANDPASYNQSLRGVRNSLSTLSHQLGMQLDSSQLDAIASSALLSGNQGNQQWLTQQISRREDYSKLKSTSGLAGGMAATVDQLQQLAGEYGYTWNTAQLAQRAQNILDGTTTIDTYKDRLKTWAASAFPSLSKDIMSGTTVKDLADPYVQSMSQILEVDPATLNVYTPQIRRALQGSRAKPTDDPTTIPLWAFENQLRADPRWATTRNARDTVSSALVKVGQDFGFSV